MAWNESGNGKDPWGNNRRRPAADNDLDKMVGNLQKKLNRMFGGDGGDNPALGLGAVLVIGLIVWGLTGFYRVDQAERGLELRFGKFTTMTDPGLHWHMPYPIETVELVNASVIDRFDKRISMLTADENFVDIDLAVQYRRSNPIDYQFNVRNQGETIADVSESAIREVVGKRTADFTLVGDRAEVASQTKELIQNALDTYKAGVEVTSVNLQQVDFPKEVQGAVQDAVKAREDKEQAKLSAETYENQVIPMARGERARLIENAEAYKQKVINDAEGDTARFSALLVEYTLAPEVTRERLYIDAIEYVYSNTNKVFIDTDGNGNLLYLPIDKMIQNGGSAVRTPVTGNRQLESVQPVQPANSNPRARRTR
ncbi:MAG: FtsH protease activity modulator HflK [Pseudomonadota bacterium]